MKTSNITISFAGDANVFIIPNTPVIPNRDISFKPYAPNVQSPRQAFLDALKDMAALNGREFDPNDPLVELWYHGEGSENFVDHGVHVEVDGQNYNMYIRTRSYIPASYFAGIKEGDTITVKIPVRLYPDVTFENARAGVWTATLTCEQKKMRYRQFGSFEDCLQRLLGRSLGYYADHPEHNFTAE